MVPSQHSDSGSGGRASPGPVHEDGDVSLRAARPGGLPPDEERITHALSVDMAREEHLQRRSAALNGPRELPEHVPHQGLGRYEQVRSCAAKTFSATSQPSLSRTLCRAVVGMKRHPYQCCGTPVL